MFHNDNERAYFLRTGYNTLTQDVENQRFEFPPLLVSLFTQLNEQFPGARACEMNAQVLQEQACREKYHQEKSMLQSVAAYRGLLKRRLKQAREQGQHLRGTCTLPAEPLAQMVALLEQYRHLQTYTAAHEDDPPVDELQQRAEIYEIASQHWHQTLFAFTRACAETDQVRGKVDGLAHQLQANLKSLLWDHNPEALNHHLARYGFPNRLHSPSCQTRHSA